MKNLLLTTIIMLSGSTQVLDKSLLQGEQLDDCYSLSLYIDGFTLSETENKKKLLATNSIIFQQQVELISALEHAYQVNTNFLCEAKPNGCDDWASAVNDAEYKVKQLKKEYQKNLTTKTELEKDLSQREGILDDLKKDFNTNCEIYDLIETTQLNELCEEIYNERMCELTHSDNI